jgi:bla regulator protein blaR1
MMTAIVDHLWQSTLFAIVAWLLTLVLRNNAARVRYWVWFAASIKFLVPFSVLTMVGNQFSWQKSTPASISNAVFTAVQQMAEPLATPEIVLRSPQAHVFDFLPIVLSIWILGCIVLLARWGVSWLCIIAAVRGAESVAIQAPIAVKATPIMSEPGVVGVVRPVLLLPEGIAASLTAAQMQAILAHELCHVRRRDNLTATMHMIVEVLFWFHPLVWWIGARLVEERERACDESVVELGNEPQAYAEGILKVCQFYLESKLTCVAGVSGANLKQRVEVIMRNRITDNLNAAKKVLLATAATLTVVAPLFFGLTASPQASAQSKNGIGVPLVFDEVSITPTASPAPGAKPSGWLLVKDGHYSAKNQPMRTVLAFAYDVEKVRVVGGPDWLDSLCYDIEAKVNGLVEAKGANSPSLYRPMLRAVLADRFGVVMHRETQSVSVFVMTVGDQGATFTKSTPSPERPAWLKVEPRAEADKSGISFQEAPMELLVRVLSGRLGRPVLDQTKIMGKYSYRLDAPYVAGAVPAETLPPLVEKQLGLTLEAQMVPLDVVVIDAIQQPTIDARNATASTQNF